MKIEKFGSKLKSLMKEKDISIKDIDRRTNLTKFELKKILKDKIPFELRHDIELSKVFLTDKGFFFTRYQEYLKAIKFANRELMY